MSTAIKLIYNKSENLQIQHEFHSIPLFLQISHNNVSLTLSGKCVTINNTDILHHSSQTDFAGLIPS